MAQHNADAVLSLRGKIDAIVEYSRWMSDPVEQAQYMLERLHLDWKERRRNYSHY